MGRPNRNSTAAGKFFPAHSRSVSRLVPDPTRRRVKIDSGNTTFGQVTGVSKLI